MSVEVFVKRTIFFDSLIGDWIREHIFGRIGNHVLFDKGKEPGVSHFFSW